MTGVRFHMVEPGLGEALVALFEREAGPSQNLTPEQIEVQIRALVAELIGNARLERSA
jgi:hypothetical protein